MFILRAIRDSGIVARLSASFVAMALLAIAANFLTDHAASTRVTRIERITTTSTTVKSAPASVAKPSPLVLAPAVNYLKALEVTYQAALNLTAANNPDNLSALTKSRDQMRLAGQVFVAQLRPADGQRASNLTKQTDALSASIDELVGLANQRRAAIGEYRRHLLTMDESLKSVLDSSFKLFGRFIARQYLLQLSGDLESIRKRFDDSVSRDADPASLKELASAEHSLATMLNGNAASLQKGQGQEWLAGMLTESSSLAQHRDSLQRLNQDYAGARARLGQLKIDLTVEVEEGLGSLHQRGIESALAPRAAPLVAEQPAELPEPVETVTLLPRDPSRDRLIAWITAAVVVCVFLISLFTVLSIVRPVRRLLRAAARLARGDLKARVASGGLKELDALGRSFNEMAERLARAHEASQTYQSRLEADVAARTRELQNLAELDPLTSLPNRRVWQRLTEECLKAALAVNRPVGVFFIDLDNFKNINDSIGHSYGDSVLLAIARRLDEISGEFGFAARLGGDEFCVVCTRAKAQLEIEQAAGALLRAFRTPMQIEQREITVSISVGVSVFPTDGTSPAQLLSAADAALFRAKSLGRNQLSRFTPELLQSANERFQLEQRLRGAVERNELELVFQPEIEVASLKVGLVEALIRWRQPDGRLAPPAEFLSVAETCGIIGDIDAWVLQKAIRTASDWHHGPWPEAKIAVNVSARQLSDPEFTGRLMALLQQHRLPARCIEIELTETALQTGPAVLETLQQLQSHAVAVALDDFGTGYSSLTSIEQLPFSRIKLDRSLISGVGSQERSTAIVRALIALCEHLNLSVTAEGVESAVQLAWLLDYKHLHLQGYHLSRPMTAANLLPVIAGMREHLILQVLTQRSAVNESSGSLPDSVELEDMEGMASS